MNKVMLINEDGFVVGEVELPPSWKKGDRLTANLSVDGKVVAELDITPNGYHEDGIGDCQHAVFGVPRMLPVINKIWDVKKAMGPPKEGDFKVKFKDPPPLPVIHQEFELLKVDEEQRQKLKGMMERYMLGLERYVLLSLPPLTPINWDYVSPINKDDDVKPDFEVRDNK